MTRPIRVLPLLVALVVPAAVAPALARKPEARELTLSAREPVRVHAAVPRLLRGPGFCERYHALPRRPSGAAAGPAAAPGRDLRQAWLALRAVRRPGQSLTPRPTSARSRLATSLKNRQIASQRD